MKNFAIIGLGTFGQQLCEGLSERGVNILAVDRNEKNVNKVASFIPRVVCCDCTIEENLKKLGFADMDKVIIAIGADIKSSILITVILKELGVKHLIVRVDDEYFVPIFKKLGADLVVNPQKLAVQNLSTALLSDGVVDFHAVTKNYGVASVEINKPGASPSLLEMNLRMRYGLNVLLIKRGGTIITPTQSDFFQMGDEVVVFGTKAAIAKLAEQFRAEES